MDATITIDKAMARQLSRATADMAAAVAAALGEIPYQKAERRASPA